MGADRGKRTLAETQPIKRRQYHRRAVKSPRASAAQLFRQRGLRGTTLGPANRGRRLDAVERQASERKMQDEGWL
jgi:hypothetical protein